MGWYGIVYGINGNIERCILYICSKLYVATSNIYYILLNVFDFPILFPLYAVLIFVLQLTM